MSSAAFLGYSLSATKPGILPPYSATTTTITESIKEIEKILTINSTLKHLVPSLQPKVIELINLKLHKIKNLAHVMQPSSDEVLLNDIEHFMKLRNTIKGSIVGTHGIDSLIELWFHLLLRRNEGNHELERLSGHKLSSQPSAPTRLSRGRIILNEWIEDVIKLAELIGSLAPHH
ncbi:MAG: hypothetical protein Q9170_007003 [Blastenia crenularia]